MARCRGVRPPPARLWHYAARHRARVVWATVLTVLNKIFDVFPEILIGVAIDVVVNENDSFVADITGVDGRWGQLVVLADHQRRRLDRRVRIEWGYMLLWRNLAQTVEHEARMDAYAHVQQLELGYFEDQSTGGLMAVLNDDVNQLERFLDTGASAIILTVVNVVVVGIVFLVASPLLALVAFAADPGDRLGQLPVPAPPGAALPGRPGPGRASSTAPSRTTSGGIATIKAFTAEEREIARVDGESDAYRVANGKRHPAQLSVRPADPDRDPVRLHDDPPGRREHGHQRDPRRRLLLGPRLHDAAAAVAAHAARRDLRPLPAGDGEHPADPRPPGHPADDRGGPGRAREAGRAARSASRTSASPTPSGPEVLQGLDIDIPAGETHAVVGLTGAGKSTIVKLLLRLYEPSEGRVTVDGVDVRELTFGELRGAIGLVSQDVFLFDGTVRENIAYGDPDAPDEAIEEAARLAEAHDFITALPHGYDTMVGERGQKLSGGQRQRLSIARAIVRNPAILVLDEATSSVDNETEAAIQRSLETVSRNRTTLVIAHRLSTIRHADRIHVLERGGSARRGPTTSWSGRVGSTPRCGGFRPGRRQRFGSGPLPAGGNRRSPAATSSRSHD